jgi:hypothetical protein
MSASPFPKYRDMVLGYYSTAGWLRRVRMAMWNGNDYKTGLSQITGLDAQHYQAFSEMVAHFRQYGESDSAFMALANDIRTRMAEEKAAADREVALDAWLDDVKHQTRLTRSAIANAIDDHYGWLERQFNGVFAISPITAFGVDCCECHAKYVLRPQAE